MTLAARWLGTIRSLLGDERGNAAIVFGLAILPLLAGAGLATDTLLAYSVEDQLQRSLDAAGLAAGRALEEEDVVPDATASCAPTSPPTRTSRTWATSGST
jgi:Flp pilus assembly protein TadG